MQNAFEQWANRNMPAGQAWIGRLLAAAAAGTATAAVWVSVVLMAGLGLPPGESQQPAQAPATADGAASAARTVRYAAALPTVTVLGRRESADKAETLAVDTAGPPARPASANATIVMSGTGDNLRQ